MRGSLLLLVLLTLLYILNTLGPGLLASTLVNTQQQAMMFSAPGPHPGLAALPQEPGLDWPFMREIWHVFGYAQGPSGPRLYWQGFTPSDPKAVLLFVHGLAEHSGRYLNPALYFAPRGYACYALDCRGHGRSSGRRVHVDRFDDYHADVRTVQALVQGRHPGLPAFLVGHSQGGLIVLDYALHTADGLAGIIVSSPALGVHAAMKPSAATVALARMLSRLAPRTLLANHVDAPALCRDETVVEAYRRDPLVSRAVSARWYTSVMEAMAAVHSSASRLSLPALVMTSGADRVVNPEATRRWAERAPRDLVEVVVWDGFYHEMFNEPERGRVYARMESWLEGRVNECPRPGAVRRSD